MLATSLLVMLLSAEPSKAELDVVRAVLQRIEFAGRSSVPDSGLLPEKGPLPVLAQLGRDGPPLGAALLAHGDRWVLKSWRDWQLAADARGTPLYVVTIGLPEVESDVAYVSVGVAVVTMTDFKGGVLCCCIASDEYRRGADGAWRFHKRGATVCA